MKKNPENSSVTSNEIKELIERHHRRKKSVLICSVLAVIVAVGTAAEMIQPATAATRKETAADAEYRLNMRENSRVRKLEEASEEESSDFPAQVFAGETEELIIEVDAPEGAFPAETAMYVETVSDEDILDAAASAAGSDGTQVTKVQAADITFTDPEGNEIEPQMPIQVVMTAKDRLPETDEAAAVYHIDDDGEAMAVELDESPENEAALAFTADSFSVYALVYTVDFHWGVDGRIFEFSIPGGGFVSLTDLVEALGIADGTYEEGDEDNTVLPADGELTLGDIEAGDAVKEFTAEVADVEFSSPELMSVRRAEESITVGELKDSLGLACEYSAELSEEQAAEINSITIEEGDWALIALKPFTSEESLTITMNNGEVFEIQVTDGQLHTYVISDSGDTYEVIVTYDDTAEIPEDAELVVREITDTDEAYAANVDVTNRELQSMGRSEITNPVQFDISIVSGGVETEPKEGSVVRTEIRLAPEAFGRTAEEGEIWFGGAGAEGSSADAAAQYTVSHITDDGTAEIIGNVGSHVNEDEKVVLEFETESFSDYLIGNPQGLNVLPDTIYVGDEIYMWERADYWVTNIGSVVDEIKHPNGQNGNDGSDWKTVRATNPGTFRIVHRNDWNNGNPYRNYKEITVLPERTGTTPPGTIETVDNASIGLTLNLFDYDLDGYLDDYFNNYNHGNNPVSNNFLNHGINNGKAFKFWGSGIGNNHGYYNQYVKNGVTSIVQNRLVNGYPYMADGSVPANQRSLAYLFTPSDGTDKEAYTNVNHLFKKEGTYYVYDSNTNYAYYDKNQGDGGDFTVYERTYRQKQDSDNGPVQDKAIGFFPFHEWDEDYDLYVNWNKKLNHHFGMSMSVPFSLPKDPKAVKDSGGQPIVFEFSGDDDLWVFIDGKLAMDIGGIHQPTSGTIDFTNRKVIVNDQQQSFDFSGLYDGEQHTLQVFYIERGGCDSNCMIKFNMTLYGNVEFDKVDAEDNTLLAGAVFGLYKDDRCTIPLTEELTNGKRRAFIIETDENGHAKFEDVPLGDYYLKEIHAPDGYPIAVGDGTVRVRVYVDGNGNVRTSVDGQENDAKILNRKPDPVDLGLKKVWKDADENTITAPDGINAVFEIKRIRTYQVYTEQEVQGEGRESSRLTVGWIHNGRPYEYEEFDLVAGSQATVTWNIAEGYTGTIGCEVNGTRYTKSPNPNNIYSQGITMPAAGQTAVLYIIDESENGGAIQNINVAGSQFYGNSGGGFIHEFHTITETDPDFVYTGPNVTNNQVTLPINENTWQYLFKDLPSIGTGMVDVEGTPQKTTFKYSYYIEEVSSSAPEGTTVIYTDLHGNEVNSPVDAETHVSGLETITNKVPAGYLTIEKKVTYNGSDQNLTDQQKTKMAGEYKFKIYTKMECGEGDAVQDPDAAPDAEDKDLVITIIIGEDGRAVSSTPVKLLAGNYWVKETESSNPAMFPNENPIAAEVTKDNTTSFPAFSSITNNYDENNGPDKISIDIEKKFQGLEASSQVPADFRVLLQYTADGRTKTVTLQNKMATGENGEKISWTQSTDGFVWHWKVTNIPSDAVNFKILEENYDNVKAYDWKSASLNGTDITSSVTSYHDLVITAPAASLSDVTDDRRTSDAGQNTEFYLDDNDILLTKLTANQGTLVISRHPLNPAERDAIEKGWPSQGGYKTPPHYFSIEEHPNGFAYGNKTVTFGEKNNRTTVKFSENASAQETVFTVSYSSDEARNNANLLNVYEEIPITIDIIKVDKNNKETKLSGAVFTLRQIADEAPTGNGTLAAFAGTEPADSQKTDENGKTSFGSLTHGYYEITEKTAPEGYILTEDMAIFFKIENGEVIWLEKGTGKPSEWAEKTSADMISYEPAKAADTDAGTPASNASFTVKNEPGAELPYTGGPGTALIRLAGIMLACFACAGLMMKSRMRRTAE